MKGSMIKTHQPHSFSGESNQTSLCLSHQEFVFHTYLSQQMPFWYEKQHELDINHLQNNLYQQGDSINE